MVVQCSVNERYFYIERKIPLSNDIVMLFFTPEQSVIVKNEQYTVKLYVPCTLLFMFTNNGYEKEIKKGYICSVSFYRKYRAVYNLFWRLKGRSNTLNKPVIKCII